MGLDPDQRAAAEIPDGPVLVVAGPGTGKTRTLTHRIAHLVTAGGVAPRHCLAITFTRRAAGELGDRLAALVPDRAPAVTVTTFHALGVRILREHHDRVGLTAGFAVADEARQLAVATEVTGSERAARRLLAARRSGADAEGAEQYAKALRQADLVDFDDLVTLPAALLESDPELAMLYQDRYRWIWVDEYQDIDEAQYRLLRLLAGPEGNLTAIGDPDQAIYGFRGADVGFFLRFRQDFPGARTVQLTRNYRSSAAVLTAALQVISPGTLVPDRELYPMDGADPDDGDALVGVHHASTEQAEASFVARRIEQLLGGASFHSLDSGRVESDGRDGLGFSDFAVLYRTDRQARALVDSFTTTGLPFQKRSHDRLADRPGVDLIVGELGGSPGVTVTERVRRAARAVVDRLAGGGAEPETVTEAESTIHSAVELLLPLAERCGDDLDRFRTELALGVEVDTWDPRADRISLLTLHAAKGLEFPVVFVVGCEDGLLPLQWPGTAASAGDVDEERRLLFVGMTRARRHLYLTHAAERAWPGAARKTTRSRFLADLDSSAYEQIGDAVPRPKARTSQLRLL